MNESKISVRYSKALFSLAQEMNRVDEVRKDMKYILELTSYNQVKELITSPVIENSVKKSALMSLLDGKVGKITLDLVKVTVKNNRESFLPGMARCYIDMADRFRGISKVSITTAVKVGDPVLKRMSDLIEKKYDTKVELEKKVDPDISGGFMLKIEDNYIDASVRTQLRRIRKELTKD